MWLHFFMAGTFALHKKIQNRMTGLSTTNTFIGSYRLRPISRLVQDGGQMSYFDKLKKMKTFLVEDSRMLRDALHQIFSYNSCYLQSTESAEEALDALAREKFDLIISDYMLPGIDGIEFFKKSARFQPQAFKVLISGNLNRSLVSRASDIGVNAVIAKPFSITTLLSSLNLQMADHHAADRLLESGISEYQE